LIGLANGALSTVSIFEKLRDQAAGRGLKFLVIGGHAVMRHGFLRATEDVDILVNKEERTLWREVVGQLGYEVFHDGGTFLQLTPRVGQGWELDLMFVSAPTFQKMITDAIPAEMQGAAILVPSLEHLLALKIHALKHGHGVRGLKDFEDLVHLVTRNGLDIRAPSMRQLFAKHGTVELYERMVKACTE
jgi:predicted nucleotidyltransferase